jgi:GT2 family glycosyltransferase
MNEVPDCRIVINYENLGWSHSHNLAFGGEMKLDWESSCDASQNDRDTTLTNNYAKSSV